MSWQTAQRVPNTAFVLSGGASLEALQVGMLRAVYSSDVESILLPAPNPTQVQPIDFDHSSRLIGEALTATRAFLARRETAVAQGLWIAHRASILPSLLALRLEKEPPGSAAFERGWRAPLAYVLRREHLRRTVRIALLVGIVPTTVNQQDVIVRGDATAITWIRCSTNFVVPFIVSNLGLLSGRSNARPEGPH